MFCGPMAEKKGFGSTVLGWFVVREGEEGGDKKDESADELIAKYAKRRAAGAAARGQAHRRAAEVRRAATSTSRPCFAPPASTTSEQGRVDKATQLLKTLPAETPQGRQEADRRGVAQGVRLSRRADHRGRRAGDSGARGLHPGGPARHAGAAGRIAEAHRRAGGGDRAHQEGDGRAGGRAVRADAGVQRAEAAGCRRCWSSSGRKRSPALFHNHRSCTSPNRARNDLGNKRSGTCPRAPGSSTRLSNLWKGFVSLWISDIEKEHPEIAYENAINSMIEKYSKLKKATAAIIRRREEVSERLTTQTKELAQVSADLAVAVETNQDDLAVVLIQKKNALEKEVAELKADLDTAQKDADRAKSSLMTRAGRDQEAQGREGQHAGQDGVGAGAHPHQRPARGPLASTPRSRRSTTCASTSRTPSPRPTSAPS